MAFNYIGHSLGLRPKKTDDLPNISDLTEV